MQVRSLYFIYMHGKSIETIRLLETSCFIQDQLAGLDKQDAEKVWFAHRPLIGSEPSLAGSRHVHIRTETAMMLKDGLTFEEQIYPLLQYDELALRGYLSDVKLIHLNGCNSVVWMLTNAVLRDVHLQETEISDDAAESDLVNPLPVGIPIRRPLYAPAKLIEFALPAA